MLDQDENIITQRTIIIKIFIIKYIFLNFFQSILSLNFLDFSKINIKKVIYNIGINIIKMGSINTSGHTQALANQKDENNAIFSNKILYNVFIIIFIF